jgi:hypothetical protein
MSNQYMHKTGRQLPIYQAAELTIESPHKTAFDDDARERMIADRREQQRQSILRNLNRLH